MNRQQERENIDKLADSFLLVQHNCKDWHRIINRAMDGIVETISGLVPVLKKATDSIVAITAEVTENIKTMPEEDFNRLLESESLDEGAKALARQIRRNGQYELHSSNDTASN